MKCYSVTLILSLVFSSLSIAQTLWETHASTNIIGDVDVYQDRAYVCHRGGFTIIDLNTGVETRYNAANSDLQGSGTAELEIINFGEAWVSAYVDGLFFFNGKGFEYHYDIHTGDTLNEVRDLVAIDDELWFTSRATDNSLPYRQLLRYKDGRFTNYKDQFDEVVTNFAFDPEEQFWLVYKNRLYQFDGEILSNEVLIPHLDSISFNVNEYFIDSQGGHWLSTYEYTTKSSLIQHYYNGTWKSYEVPNREVNEFFEIEQGHIAFTMYRYHGAIINDQFQIDSTTLAYPEVPAKWGDVAVKTYDSQGGVWIANFDGYDEPQLYRLHSGEWSTYADNTGILSALTNELATDCEGNIIVTGSYLIEKYNGEAWSKLIERYDRDECESFQHLAVNPMTCDIWVTAHGGLCTTMYKIDESGPEEIDFGLEGCTDLVFDAVGNMYVCYNEGLAKIDSDGEITAIYDSSNSPVAGPYSITYASDGSLWVVGYNRSNGGSDGTLLSRLHDNNWTSYSYADTPLPKHYMRSVYEDSSGQIWTPNESGLVKFDGSQWIEYAFELSKERSVLAMLEDPKGNYWIATLYDGLLYWDGLDYISYKVDNSDILGPWCEQLVYDGDGNLWVRHNYGLTKMEISGSLDQPAAKGYVYYDQDRSGVYGDTELRLPAEKVVLNAGEKIAFTNAQGAYAFYDIAEAVTHEISYPNEDEEWQLTSQNPLAFNLQGESITDLHFGLWKEHEFVTPDLDLTIAPIVCASHTKAWVTVKNNNVDPLVGILTLDHSALFGQLIIAPGESFASNSTVVWQDIMIPPMQTRTYSVTFAVPGWETVYDGSDIVDSLDIDQEPQEFEFKASLVSEEVVTENLQSVYLCAYDPNDKLVQSSGEEREDLFLLEDALDYTIRFQNLGNYKATDVVILDTLDSDLDLTSFEYVSSSHPCETNLTKDGIVTFRFIGIDLPPEEESLTGSQGFVKYAIKSKAGTPTNSDIRNTASIYFDHNPGIRTNTTSNIGVDEFPPASSPNESESPIAVEVFPNPSSGQVYVKGPDQSNKSITVLSNDGRILIEENTDRALWQVELTTGIYFIKVVTESCQFIKKIIVSQ